MTCPRIGVDVVSVSRACRLLEWSLRPVLQRMLSPAEIDDCTRAGHLDALAVAGRLAVKEAVFKLLHTRETVVPWRDIAVCAPRGTWPEVVLTGRAARIAAGAGVRGPVAVSLSHDGDYATGVAIAVIDTGRNESPTTPVANHGNEEE